MGFDISMKWFSKFRMLAMVATVLMAIGTRAEAQVLALSATTSTNLVVVSNSVTYTINVTNLTSSVFFAFVTNTFPSTAQLLGASITPSSGTTVTNANGFSFNNISLGGVSAWAQMTVTVAPTQSGLFTNTITVFVLNVTNAIAYAVTLVTNAPPAPAAQADLAVAMTGPPSAVFVNDSMTYGVNVTNLGPASASNVTLTNTLVTGVQYIGVSPSGLTPTVVGSNVIFNLGTLASNAIMNVQLTVQPTPATAGSQPFSASVGSSSVTDPNPTNNTATTNVTIYNYFSTNLVAYTNSAQIIDFQNALTVQSITVSNAGPSSVAAVRVVVTGLKNQLFNAVGSNNGNPFVVYNAPLNTNQTVNLLLQYYPRGYFSFTNGQLHAFGVTNLNLAPPVAAAGTNVNISHILRRSSDGSILLIWPSTPGRVYTVVYSDNVLFSNAMIAPPSVVAPANQTPWIDYGPPTTVSQPKNSTNRFYRIYLNP